MKKIDLHVHTISTDSDRPFVFDVDPLKEYVKVRQLDCVAITNHNTFDIEQFKEIQQNVDILVLPGIEIDLEGSQLLLIGDTSNLDDFDSKCKIVTERAPNKRNSISTEELEEIFGTLSQYILIPHYDKSPAIRDETLAKFGKNVTAGEVASPKKFMYCMNNDDRLVPVYFSDCRIESELTEFPVRQTYIACEEVTFAAIKSCLRDKNKVALSLNDGNNVFQIFDDGQQLSTGLNVVLGERSTGKSHTLKRIHDLTPNAKYLPQFSLVSRNELDDEKKFNKFLSDKNSLFSREYLAELQHVVNDVIDVEIEVDNRAVDAYLKSLLKHARESEKHDSFSRAGLFNAERFSDIKQKGLEDLIGSTQNLIKNVEFRAVIDKHIKIDSLKNLILELMTLHATREEERLRKKWVNELVSEVKRKLQVRTAATAITDLDLYSIAMNKVCVTKFEEATRAARRPRELDRKQLQGFALVATAGEFEGAMQLKKLSRSTLAFSDAYEVYDDPYSYLQELKNIEGLADADLYRYFVKVDFKILNKDGFEASGGERSEFNLLQEIQDAQKKDILLIDEPESSFDNIFLKQSVNEIIKGIAKNMPVVLVTHNNTVGASIKPDYVLYTKKEIEDSQIEYRIYSGYPSSKTLRSTDGTTISTYDVTMGCLEAGVDTYEDRRVGYEDIKN